MSEWPKRSLQEVCTELTVGHVGSMAAEYIADGVPFLRSQNVKTGRLDFSKVKYISPKFHQRLKKSKLSSGDIVIVRTGEPGAAALIPNNLGELNCSDLVIARPREDVDARYLCYAINATAGKYIAAHLVGAVQQHFNVASARKLLLSIPPIDTQQSIASVLCALDDKINSNLAIILDSNKLAATIFKAKFEQGDSVEVARLGDMADVIDCLHARKPEFTEDGRRYLILSDIRDDSRLEPTAKFTVSDKDYQEWTRRIEAHQGDCLLTNVGRVGAVGQIPKGVTAAIGRNMTGVRGRAECPPSYLVEALRSATVRREIEAKTDHGTVLSALNVKTIPDLLLPAGNARDRQAFQEQTGLLHELQDQLLQENVRLAVTRDTLLPKMMSGEIQVRDAEKSVEDVT